MTRRAAMAHEAPDLPPRLATLAKAALGLGSAALAVALYTLKLCLEHA